MLHHLNGGYEPHPREPVRNDALDIDVVVCARAPDFEQDVTARPGG